MIKILKYIFVVVFIVLQSCKSHKNITYKKNDLTKGIYTADKIIKSHIEGQFTKKTIDSKLAVKYQNDKDNFDFSVRMKIKKDSVIWLKGSKFITIFKIKITPKKFSYYSPYKKDYFEGDFSLLEKMLGVNINFKQLQNLLLGQAMFDLNDDHNVSITNTNEIIFYPKKQRKLFDIFYNFNPASLKLNNQKIEGRGRKKLEIFYPKYTTNDAIIPEEINIKALQNDKKSIIGIKLRSVEFDNEINTPFKIPEGYKKIKL